MLRDAVGTPDDKWRSAPPLRRSRSSLPAERAIRDGSRRVVAAPRPHRGRGAPSASARDMSRADAQLARTSPIWSTRAHSWNTAATSHRGPAPAPSGRRAHRAPADGLVAGTARVDGDLFGRERGVGGPVLRLHRARRDARRLPWSPQEGPALRTDRADAAATVFFAEGGGGRPGDTDYPVVSASTPRAFVGSPVGTGAANRDASKGRCFAGNAVIAGCADLIVATNDASMQWAAMHGRRRAG